MGSESNCKFLRAETELSRWPRVLFVHCLGSGTGSVLDTSERQLRQSSETMDSGRAVGAISKARPRLSVRLADVKDEMPGRGFPVHLHLLATIAPGGVCLRAPRAGASALGRGHHFLS